MSLRSLVAPTVIILGTAIAAPAMGAALGLSPTAPDVASGFINVDYNATTHAFTASGFTQNLNLPPTQGLGNRTFTLNASIDNAGNIDALAPFLFEVRGDFMGTNTLLYHATSLAPGANFGFSAVAKFEFVFLNDFASPLPGVGIGTKIGTILSSAVTTFPGNVPVFTQNFTNHTVPIPGAGVADSFPVPAPSAGALAALAGVVVMGRRRR